MEGGWHIIENESAKLPQRVASGFTQAFEGMQGASYKPLLY